MSYYRKRRLLPMYIIVLAGLICSLQYGKAMAQVAKGEIESIRGMNVINEQYAQKITDYVNQQFQEMLSVTNASDLSLPVRNLIDNSASKVKRAEVMKSYSDTFASAVKSGYQAVLSSAQGQDDTKLSQAIKLSAVVILAFTDNRLLIEELLTLLKDENEDVSYWSARGLGMTGIQTYLISNDPEADSDRTSVVTALAETLDSETSGLVIARIALAAPVHPEGVGIIQQSLSKRLGQYQSWNVQDELEDRTIIQKIFEIVERDKLQNDRKLEADLIRSATELFSIAYQRYTKSMQYVGPDGEVIELLPMKSRRELITLLVDSEAGFLHIVRSDRRPRFPGAIQKNKWKDMEANYNYLLGVGGPLNQQFSIYPEGAAEPQLPQLPEPPENLIERAKILKQIEDKTIANS